MKAFRKLALSATIATYFLIFVGGLVRVSGAGLGCPDWPKCFGRWVPPTDISQLPPEMDPSTFNFVLAWIEYVNRLVGVFVGLLIAGVGFMAIMKMRKHKSILIAAISAAILVAYQGWQGSQVVASELEPIIVSVHMGIAFIIASLLLFVTVRAYELSNQTSANTGYPKKARLFSGLLWLAVIIQVILGTQVRTAVEISAEQFPLFSPSAWLESAGLYGYTHSILGIAIAVGGYFVSSRILGKSTDSSPLVRQSAWALLGVSFMQAVFGVMLYTAGLPAVIQVMHLWLAAMIAGFTLILFISQTQAREVQ